MKDIDSKTNPILKAKFDKHKVKLQKQADDLIALINISLQDKIVEADKNFKKQSDQGSEQIKQLEELIK